MTMQECTQCKENKNLIEFYKKDRISDRVSRICKSCSNKNTIQKMIKTKIRMINYKGGKCENCGISLEDSHYCIFDFHHQDPNIKDTNFRSVRGWTWERIIKEIENCSLLCSNCHRIKHQKILP